jgi:hypothetical protein
MGELMNQVVGDFTGKVRRELQTHITQNQPKMLVLNKQVMLSVDANLDNPEARRVTFYTGNNNIFYLELAIDRTEFIKLYDFEPRKPRPRRADGPGPPARARCCSTCRRDGQRHRRPAQVPGHVSPRRPTLPATRPQIKAPETPVLFSCLDFHISIIIELWKPMMLSAMVALAQASRLEIFRALVVAGTEGTTPSPE